MGIKGKVGIPNEYFLKMAKHDYENYQYALAREFYQNSIDAGAKNIEVTQEGESITVKDDGCGMNLDVLQNKLLVLGGSHKADNAVGAFGKAKEVLFFSWESYKIRTQDLLVRGCGAEYEITEGLPYVEGTTCRIKVTDFGNPLYYFRIVAQKMQTKTKIWVDEDLIKCDNKKGRLVRVVADVGNVHQVKKYNNYSMAVRINGIWMFDMYVGENMGSLVLELSRGSLETLTSNRDGFKWECRSQVSSLIQDLTVNKAAALRDNKPTLQVNIPGSGKVKVGGVAMATAKLMVRKDGDVKAVLESIMRVSDDEGATPIQRARIAAMPKIKEDEWDEFTAAIKFIGYEPNFVLLQYEDQDKQNFIGTKKARLLATMWTEIIKQVMIDNERYLEFTAGFIFDPKAEASLLKKGDETTILLNPDMIKVSKHRRIIMEELKDLAIHELAHLRYSNHDNDFVNEMAEIRKNTYKDDAPYRAIQRTRVR